MNDFLRVDAMAQRPRPDLCGSGSGKGSPLLRIMASVSAIPGCENRMACEALCLIPPFPGNTGGLGGLVRIVSARILGFRQQWSA
jgi:hypothetical protein